MSISPQPTMPASVEILTKTHEFLSTKVSTLVTLMLSFGPTAAALVRSAVNSASRPNSVPVARRLAKQERRSSCLTYISMSIASTFSDVTHLDSPRAH